MVNPLDIFLGMTQGIVALLLVFKIDGLPDLLIYFLATMLVVSGVMDIFGV